MNSLPSYVCIYIYISKTSQKLHNKITTLKQTGSLIFQYSFSMPSMGSTRKPMKVVIINTHYVETDATSFKSVVQKLTGKDSTLANDQQESESRIFRERILMTADSTTSFKEFDRLLREMPPLLIHELWE
jgi:hypothetical protein